MPTSDGRTQSASFSSLSEEGKKNFLAIFGDKFGDEEEVTSDNPTGGTAKRKSNPKILNESFTDSQH